MLDQRHSRRAVRVGVLGCGTVGAAVCEILHNHAGTIAENSSVPLQLVRVVVRDIAKQRASRLPPSLMSSDAIALVTDPDIDVVIELMGGLSPAQELVSLALKSGKSVVTANKALIAAKGTELFPLADESEGDIYFEAAVAGAIPLVRTLQVALAGEPLQRIVGILNGTTNFILSEMSATGSSFTECLETAQLRGFAEADPSADVSGADTTAKAAILARIAFGTVLTPEQIHCEGIEQIDTMMLEVARDLECSVKLLAIIQKTSFDASLVARVHPALVPRAHVLSSVQGAYNAVYIQGTWLGDTMLYGLGAGPMPTASAVVSDTIAAAQNLPAPIRSGGPTASADWAFMSRVCVVVTAIDRPGVLATIDGCFARCGVGLSSILIKSIGGEPRVVMTTKHASQRSIDAALAGLRELDVVDSVHFAIRFFDAE